MVQNEPPSLPLLSESLSWRSDSIKTPVTARKREPGRGGPIRLVVGFLRIVLVVENVPGLRWHILDYFPVVSANDGDLLMVVEEMRRYGYGSRFRVEGDLSPAV